MRVSLSYVLPCRVKRSGAVSEERMGRRIALPCSLVRRLRLKNCRERRVGAGLRVGEGMMCVEARLRLSALGLASLTSHGKGRSGDAQI